MMKFDRSPDVVAWASEEISIPYISPLDNRPHRYFPDFWMKNSKGDAFLIEIKPLQECKPPKKKGKKTTPRMLAEAKTFAINQAKWTAAEQFAAMHGMKFQVLTEKDLSLW